MTTDDRRECPQCHDGVNIISDGTLVMCKGGNLGDCQWYEVRTTHCPSSLDEAHALVAKMRDDFRMGAFKAGDVARLCAFVRALPSQPATSGEARASELAWMRKVLIDITSQSVHTSDYRLALVGLLAQVEEKYTAAFATSARRAAPLSNTDPRPTCIECGNQWTPAEGVDATVTACCAAWPHHAESAPTPAAGATCDAPDEWTLADAKEAERAAGADVEGLLRELWTRDMRESAGSATPAGTSLCARAFAALKQSEAARVRAEAAFKQLGDASALAAQKHDAERAAHAETRDQAKRNRDKWGSCVDCPRDDGVVKTWKCVNAERYDHNIEDATHSALTWREERDAARRDLATREENVETLAKALDECRALMVKHREERNKLAAMLGRGAELLEQDDGELERLRAEAEAARRELEEVRAASEAMLDDCSLSNWTKLHNVLRPLPEHRYVKVPACFVKPGPLEGEATPASFGDAFVEELGRANERGYSESCGLHHDYDPASSSSKHWDAGGVAAAQAALSRFEALARTEEAVEALARTVWDNDSCWSSAEVRAGIDALLDHVRSRAGVAVGVEKPTSDAPCPLHPTTLAVWSKQVPSMRGEVTLGEETIAWLVRRVRRLEGR